ncbi:hypothetical protein VTN00DRAFT_1900 [Thermoascus crustaceus]|uniref:uncharacterized protein n=1 Tax=Thermoascus crustaceus TaxID=5088 RepID=UPI003743AAA0
MKFSIAVAAFGVAHAALAAPAPANKRQGGLFGGLFGYSAQLPSGFPSELPSGFPTPTGRFPFATGGFPGTPSASILPSVAVPAGKIPGELEPPVKRDFPFTSGSFPATPSATGLPTQAVPAGKIPSHHPIRNFDSVVRRDLDLFGSEGKEEGFFLGFPAASGSFPTATAYGHPSATPSGTYPSGVASGFPF